MAKSEVFEKLMARKKALSLNPPENPDAKSEEPSMGTISEVVQESLDDLKVIGLGKTGGFVLYVDCFPVRTRKQVIHFADLIKTPLRRMCEKFNIEDYKMLQYEGAAQLRATLVNYLKEKNLDDCIVVMSLASCEDRDCLSVMQREAIEEVWSKK